LLADKFIIDLLVKFGRGNSQRREVKNRTGRAGIALPERLVLERLVYELASESKPATPIFAPTQLSFES
jgi:hypothetical protein